MKPGDHPQFFRFPAPEGRSRESTIVLSEDGWFLHDGARVEHPGMARAFASWIRRHPDDGRYVLSNGYDWTYFRVEGTPFFVERVLPGPDGSFLLELFDGTSEPLDPAALRVDGRGALVVPVKGGEYFAAFTRSAQLSLEPHLTAGPDGRLQLGGVELPQVRLEA